MGNQLTGRLGSNSGHQMRTNPDETIYSYSVNKSYFSNFFIMAGERFEAPNPDYLFGENCDLNYLSCTKPLSFPYKQSQSYLMAASSKKSNSRVNLRNNTSRNKTINHLKSRSSKVSTPKNLQPSQALKCLINIRKETLRLVKISTPHNLSQTISMKNSYNPQSSYEAEDDETIIPKLLKERNLECDRTDSRGGSHSIEKPSVADSPLSDGIQTTIDHTTSPGTTTGKSYSHRLDNIEQDYSDSKGGKNIRQYSKLRIQDCSQSDVTSFDDLNLSHEKSRDRKLKPNGNVMYQNYQPVIDLEQVTGDTMNNESLSTSTNSDTSRSIPSNLSSDDAKERLDSSMRASTLTNNVNCGADDSLTNSIINKGKRETWSQSNSQVYNIEFNFDTEVDCTVRIYYFCRRQIAASGIVYEPLHKSYMSQIYHYKSGLNHKFQQADHTFQPDLFDEDNLSYKPFDQAGNFDPTALFPVVIHCIAQDGSYPRQSHSMVAIIEKNQNDGSYSIKPLKQLLFVDGLQYLLQEIYGIENKHLASRQQSRKVSSSSVQKSSSIKSNSTYSNMGSTSSIDKQTTLTKGKTPSYQHDNLFECVICMSEERDTLLLPCRHLCLCNSCAHHLRYQANNCPICRAPFRALIHIRAVHKSGKSLKDQDRIDNISKGAKTTSSTTIDSSSKNKEKMSINHQQMPLMSRESVVSITGQSSSVTTLTKTLNTVKSSLTSTSIQGNNHNNSLELSNLDNQWQYSGVSNPKTVSTPTAITTSTMLPVGYEYTSLFTETMKDYDDYRNLASYDGGTD